MDLRNTQDIEKLDDKLLEIVNNEWGGLDGLFANLSEVNIDYAFNEPMITMKIKFGRYTEHGINGRWEKEIELQLISDNLDFIAGQFTQAIIERSL